MRIDEMQKLNCLGDYLANASKEWESVKRILIPNNDENWVQLWWNVSYIGVQRVIERDFQLVALNERSRKFREKEVEQIEKNSSPNYKNNNHHNINCII